jgi:hypothetical protein
LSSGGVARARSPVVQRNPKQWYHRARGTSNKRYERLARGAGYTSRLDVGVAWEAVRVIERPVDFHRHRGMRCGACGHEWRVSAEWLDRFDQGYEACPHCGTDCQAEDRPDFWAREEDPSLDDLIVLGMYWYHSSTHANWPDPCFDPAARLTELTKQRMGKIGAEELGLERWARGQKTKALHLGTYEAAIENMLRRIRDQGSSRDQFYLYRVRLSPDAVIEPGVHPEPTNFVGDVQLAEVGGPGIDAYRYVNTHEDPSSISLAVTMQAIRSVQRISVPLPVAPRDPWVTAASLRLAAAASLPSPEPRTELDRFRGRMPSALHIEARELEAEVAESLPVGLRDRFHVSIDEAVLKTDPAVFTSKLVALARLVTDPRSVLTALNAQPWRPV